MAARSFSKHLCVLNLWLTELAAVNTSVVVVEYLATVAVKKRPKSIGLAGEESSIVTHRHWPKQQKSPSIKKKLIERMLFIRQMSELTD